jgi:hypothetical protein
MYTLCELSIHRWRRLCTSIRHREEQNDLDCAHQTRPLIAGRRSVARHSLGCGISTSFLSPSAERAFLATRSSSSKGVPARWAKDTHKPRRWLLNRGLLTASTRANIRSVDVSASDGGLRSPAEFDALWRAGWTWLTSVLNFDLINCGPINTLS